MKRSRPCNDAAGLIVSERLPMKTTQLDYGKKMMLDAKKSVSWAWPSVNPVTLVPSWIKLLPDLEVDLKGSPNEGVRNSYMVCAVRSFENINKETLKNGYRVMRVKWASSI
jgi:hypothetical protein